MQEAMRGLTKDEKGGPVYLVMMIKKIISTSQTALRGLQKKLENMKLTDYDGENVRDCVSFVRGANQILQDHKNVPSDIANIILEVFEHSSCERFVTKVTQIRNSIELRTKDYQVDEILNILEEDYTDKLGSGKWTAKDSSKNEGSAFSLTLSYMMCFNCGKFGHGVRNCPEPIDEAAIAKRKKLVVKEGNNHSNNTRKGKGGKRFQKDKDEGDTNSERNKETKKQPPKKGESHEKDFNGKKLYWCGKCGKWTNHKTSEHRPKKSEEKTEEDKPEVSEGANAIIGGATALHFG
jgi:hypothetical protein